VATPIGPSGALTVFSPGTIPYTTLAWSARTQSGFTRPAPVRDAHTINAPLVASGAGEFIAAWTHSFGFVNAPTEVRAATGTPQTFGTPQTVVPAGGHANTFAAGIDATGDAVIVWNTTTSLRGAVGLQASILR
jgi:hypothetical protein